MEEDILATILDSWDRNNAITIGLLRLLPDDAIDIRAAEDSPTAGELFMHMHYVRLVFVEENAPEFGKTQPDDEWRAERDRGRIEQMLNESAKAVRNAAKHFIETAREMPRHYDHPVLMLQHLVWHEGYHHGQIKLALKRAGRAIDDDTAGAVTWDLWMEKGIWKATTQL